MIGERSGATIVTTTKLAVPAAVAGRRDRYGFAVTFDRPLLVDAERVAGNSFVGAAVIPGAVFKGALARKLELIGGNALLAEYSPALTDLVISHAFPADCAGKPGGEPLPLSIIGVDQDDSDAIRPHSRFDDALPGPLFFGDALRHEGDAPALDVGATIEGRPGIFEPDWKDSWRRSARQRFGQGGYKPPDRLPRTHTKIEDETGISAEAQLYTAIALSTRDPTDRKKPRHWLMTVDLHEVISAEQERARRLVTVLQGGLDGIGKTFATATFCDRPEGAAAPLAKPIFGKPDLYAVMLRTSAVLTDPRTKLAAAGAYKAYWDYVIPGVRLVDFCARQFLAGGYLAMRHRPWPGIYHPFVVTAPGSMFLLAGNIGDPLNELIRTGLPLPVFEEAAPLDWRSCPFVPGNGYGEIRADHLSDEATVKSLARVEHV